jgi:hypothetical protein
MQRINTQGGKLSGVCDQAGKLRAAPYAAAPHFAVNSFKSAAKESTSSFVVSQLHIRRA